VRFMNEWDIEEAQVRYSRHRIKRWAARIIKDLMNLTNTVSDGWPYWSAPCKSAAQLIAVVEDMENPTEADLRKALSPIKAMFTRTAKAWGGKTINFEEADTLSGRPAG
jgi:hypothetical protein